MLRIDRTEDSEFDKIKDFNFQPQNENPAENAEKFESQNTYQVRGKELSNEETAFLGLEESLIRHHTGGERIR